MVAAVLDALSAPMGAQDTRTHGQRYHDALHEAMRQLAASDLLPERAGQPVKAWVHVSLAELRAMDQDSALQGEWITAVRGLWAAARAAASVGGSDGAAWLDGDAARAVTCDALVVPVVTGEVDLGVLDDLVRLCVTLAGHHGPAGRAGQEAGQGETEHPCCGGAPRLTAHAREMLERQIIGNTIILLLRSGSVLDLRGSMSLRLTPG